MAFSTAAVQLYLRQAQEANTFTLSFNFTPSHPAVEITVPLGIQCILHGWDRNQSLFDSFVSPIILS